MLFDSCALGGPRLFDSCALDGPLLFDSCALNGPLLFDSCVELVFVSISRKTLKQKLLIIAYWSTEGGWEIRPWIHHIVFRTQVILKIYSVPLWFYSEPLMLSSEPLHLKSVKKCFTSYLILKANSVHYHDGVHFVAMCKFWTNAKNIF